jgi:deoxyribodipyrimidine photo-lyase
VTTTVVWFRRDLRVHDHPGLWQAVADGDRVAPLFVVDERLLAGRWRSPNRLWFVRGSLEALGVELAGLGAPLTVLRGDPRTLVAWFASVVGAACVVASRDYTPYGRTRDEATASALRAAGIAFRPAPGGLIVEPEAVETAAGTAYRVYAPFRRAWLAAPRREVLPAPAAIRGPRVPRPHDACLLDLPHATPTADPAALPEPGEAAARGRLELWATGPALDRYAEDRDRLDVDGTSHLGADLPLGLLSPAEVAERCAGPGEGRRRFLDELAWREFYAHALFHEPRIAREAWQTAFEDVAREADPSLIEAWAAGRTGYPAVDAAMRQLLATGWIANRARMLAASFLVKQLGVDWRVGEAHFMRHLVDGDPASNGGNWQWVASVGMDAQPWFRTFSPSRQGRRHDPDGDWVRRWVPELRGVAGPAVHEPPPGAYLPPIVDDLGAREAALAAYRDALARRSARTER